MSDKYIKELQREVIKSPDNPFLLRKLANLLERVEPQETSHWIMIITDIDASRSPQFYVFSDFIELKDAVRRCVLMMINVQRDYFIQDLEDISEWDNDTELWLSGLTEALHNDNISHVLSEVNSFDRNNWRAYQIAITKENSFPENAIGLFNNGSNFHFIEGSAFYNFTIEN